MSPASVDPADMETKLPTVVVDTPANADWLQTLRRETEGGR